LQFDSKKEAFTKLQNLNLRDIETKKTYLHVVDLIQYAAKNLDTGVESTSKLLGESINKGVGYMKETPKIIVDKASSLNRQQTKEQVIHLTQDAIIAVLSAIDLLSKQVPEPIMNQSLKLFDKANSVAHQLEEANYTFYTSIASKSSEKLRETSTLLSNTIQNSDLLSRSILQQAKVTLSGILEGLLVRQRDYSVDNSNSTPTPTSVNSQ